MKLAIKNKRILITAGPTWVPIDPVRVISNIASGETGILLAQELNKQGARVTLVLGPVGYVDIDRNIELIRFRFFDELRDIILKEIRAEKYDILIHTAAVSDYKPLFASKKIKSGIKGLKLVLEPTPKIINFIKKVNPDIFLVGFKFEPGVTKKVLLDQAKRLMFCSGADLVVANSLIGNSYRAYIVSKQQISGCWNNKKQLIKNLIKVIVSCNIKITNHQIPMTKQ